jgi:hypothetical protein
MVVIRFSLLFNGLNIKREAIAFALKRLECVEVVSYPDKFWEVVKVKSD